MELFREGEWIRPYEKYGPELLKENAWLGRKMLAVQWLVGVDDASREAMFREQELPRLEGDDATIELDKSYVNPVDIYRAEDDKKIFYPYRIPKANEIEERGSGEKELRHAIRGFGDLQVFLNILRSDVRYSELEELQYPFVLEVLAHGSHFQSTAHVSIFRSEVGAGYHQWQSLQSQELGYIFIPVNLPTLMDLQFKKTRVG